MSRGWSISVWGVARTTDGGRVWRLANPAGLTKKRYGSCGLAGGQGPSWHGAGAMDARGPRRAWLAVACPPSGDQEAKQVRIFRTSDAGRSWQSAIVRLPLRARSPPLLALTFVDSTTGWLIAEGPGIAGPPTLISVLRTRDSGESWRLVHAYPPACIILGFQSPSRGYADCLSNSLPEVDFAHFPYVTNDGGRTWRHPRVAVPPGYHGALLTVGQVVFSGSARAAMAVSMSLPTSDHTLCTIYHTRDGGVHWWHSPFSDAICATAFFSPAVAWASDLKTGAVLRTTDGGRHWTMLPQAQVAPPWGTQFLTPRDGFLLGAWRDSHDGIWRISDCDRTCAATLIVPRLLRTKPGS